MFKTIWQFKIKPENRERFEAAYGPAGAWFELFRKAEGYLETTLTIDPVDNTTYQTVDIWRTREDFESFKANWHNEYKELDQLCEPLTETETHLNSFIEPKPHP